MKLFRSIITVGGLTGLSRVLGLLRDTLIAALMGAGPLADVFWVAFKIPNFFRRLLAEGAMAAAFIPIFSRLKTEHGYGKAIQEVHDIHTVLGIILLSLVIGIEVGAPLVIRIIAPGFYNSPCQFQLAIELTRVTFPYIFFIALAAFYGCILNTEDKFAASAASPVILNIVMISALGLSLAGVCPAYWALAWGVLIAGVLQWAFMLMSLKQLGDTPRFIRPRLSPVVKGWMKGMAPGAIGAGAMQINILIDTVIASLLPAGAVSYLFYADRLNQLPLSLLGIGISTVLLPHLSQKIAERKLNEACVLQNRTLEYTLFFTLPAAVALAILGCDIICVLFERAEFTRANVLSTGYTLAAFAVGLPAYVFIKIFSSIFFAYRDTRTPVIIGLFSIILNVVINISLLTFLHHIGIALATSLAAWFNALCLATLLYRRGHLLLDERLKQRAVRIGMASFVMLGGLVFLKSTYTPLSFQGFFHRAFALGGIITLGGGLYVVAALLLQAFDLKEIRVHFFPEKAPS